MARYSFPYHEEGRFGRPARGIWRSHKWGKRACLADRVGVELLGLASDYENRLVSDRDPIGRD